MPSIFVIKEKIENPKEWYAQKFEKSLKWEFDELLKKYHSGNVYLKEGEDSTSFDDFSEDEFFGWETSSWVKLAEDKELIYGYYNDDNGNAEFVHIKDGRVVRDYREYDFELDTDEGDEPDFENWVSVASYVDKNLL